MALNYQDELKKFQDKWNLPGYDFEKLTVSATKLRYVNEVFSNTSINDTPAGHYVAWAESTLNLILEANINPNEKGNYLYSFNAEEFLESFEDLAESYNNSLPEEKKQTNRKPREGASANAFKAAFDKSLKPYGKTMPSMWQERLKKGSINLEDLQTITNNSFKSLKDGNFETAEEKDGKLTNIIAAREAMTQLRNSRSNFWGWLWKLFNSDRDTLEKDYLADLDQKINELKDTYAEVETKIADITGKTATGKTIQIEEKPKEKEPEKEKPSPAKKSAKPAKFKPCAQKVSNNFYNNDLYDKLTEELLKKVPIPGADNYRRQTISRGVIAPAFDEHIKSLNEQFDKDMKNGNQRDAMAKLVRGIFKTVNNYNSIVISGSSVKRVQGCEILANMFINNLTAVSLYPDLAGVANEYIKNNLAIFKKISEEGRSYRDTIDNYSLDHVPNDNEERFNAFEDDDLFNDSIIDTSPKVSNEIKQAPPSLDGKK
jgi:hypothetical protein